LRLTDCLLAVLLSDTREWQENKIPENAIIINELKILFFNLKCVIV
jgi:hypothetical protein